MSSTTFIISEYRMAGMAIFSLAKMNGLEAMAMACAAFCMPTSMTTVRRWRASVRTRRDSRDEQPMATRISAVTHRPKMPILSRMVRWCWI